MAFNGYLTTQEINDLQAAALQGGLHTVPRQTLLAGIPPGFAAALPLASNPLDQFVLDLVETNKVERMAGGEVPVVTFLQNAAARLRLLDRVEARAFERVLNRVENVAAGVPPLPEPAQLPEVVQNERIIGLDDTLDLGFLAGGLQVARAVALVAVPRFENGQQIMVAGGPWVSRGTAWLVAPSLAITNHHVINARLDNEADAGAADLELQAKGATLRFDFDTKDADGVSVKTRRLVAASKALDYALLELADPSDRPIPQLAPSLVQLDTTSRMAVNIVQHPRGEHKQVAFRNNLVSAADATTVRYFTDTDHGSSGSPVCDDRWRVVALHRGARHTSGVQFQGKDEAFVNFGSQIQAVLTDIAANDPPAAATIAASAPQAPHGPGGG
jgi:endonuclease G, mitochondrial